VAVVRLAAAILLTVNRQNSGNSGCVEAVPI
jgi:hypothetical protein